MPILVHFCETEASSCGRAPSIQLHLQLAGYERKYLCCTIFAFPNLKARRYAHFAAAVGSYGESLARNKGFQAYFRIQSDSGNAFC